MDLENGLLCQKTRLQVDLLDQTMDNFRVNDPPVLFSAKPASVISEFEILKSSEPSSPPASPVWIQNIRITMTGATRITQNGSIRVTI